MRATRPSGQRLFHIFPDDSTRSVCGKVGVLFPDPEAFEPLAEWTRWVKGQDCKACWRKAGQPIEEASP